MLFATNPSAPPQLLGNEPGAANGMKYFVWGACSSTCSASASGRSRPFAFKDGDTYAVTVIAPPMLLKVKKSYSLSRVSVVWGWRMRGTYSFGPAPAVKLAPLLPERGHGVTPDMVLP